jgi:hypothetical protein
VVSRIGVLFLVVAMLLVSACGTTTPTTAPTAAPADGQSAPAPAPAQTLRYAFGGGPVGGVFQYMLMSFP